MHKTVLLHETIDGLNLKQGDAVVDCTLNDGGHSKEVFSRMGDGVTLIGIDADSSAISRAEAVFKDNPHFKAFNSNFRHLDKVLVKAGFDKVSGFIFDLGLSSNQLEDAGRGFTFQKDEPLLMTFSKNPGKDELTAFEIVNTWDEANIKTIIESYGEEQFASKIAKAIVNAREIKPITKTSELVSVIKEAVPLWYQHRKTHPATKTFQALRMTVNDEIGALQEGLEKAWLHLKSGGRISVISFHSLEDRIVKNWMKEKATTGQGTLIVKKPIVPTREESKTNPRSRSSKLRIIEKLS